MSLHDNDFDSLKEGTKFPYHYGGGNWFLSNGEKIKGTEEEAVKAELALGENKQYILKESFGNFRKGLKGEEKNGFIYFINGIEKLRITKESPIFNTLIIEQ